MPFAAGSKDGEEDEAEEEEDEDKEEGGVSQSSTGGKQRLSKSARVRDLCKRACVRRNEGNGAEASGF
jgi:hypothetical protein